MAAPSCGEGWRVLRFTPRLDRFVLVLVLDLGDPRGGGYRGIEARWTARFRSDEHGAFFFILFWGEP